MSMCRRLALPAMGRRAWLAYAIAACIAITAIYGGLRLRRAMWDFAPNIRLAIPSRNAIEWGRYANRPEIGVFNLYDRLVNQYGESGDYKGPAQVSLDYPPLRLLIASSWAAWAQKQFPPPNGQQVSWQPQYEFTQPMLMLNTASELAAAVAMFLLTRYWTRQCAKPSPPPARRWNFWRSQPTTTHTALTVTATSDSVKYESATEVSSCESGVALATEAYVEPVPLGPIKGLFPALLAALLVWFNPALIWNAHVYPQWDAWLLPGFLFAVYFALCDWWLPAGLAVGITAMAKGQILFVTPMLVLWPILQLRFMPVVRLAIGIGAGMGVVLWPWLLRDPAAQTWLLGISIGCALLLPLFFIRFKGWKWRLAQVALGLVGGAIMLWPLLMRDLMNCYYAVALIALLVLGAMVLRRRYIATWLAAAWAGGLAITVLVFGASTAWLTVGLMYGTRHWRQLYWCQAANLGAILQDRFQWRYADMIDLGDYLPWIGSWAVPIRGLMVGVFCFMLLLCTIGLAIHHHRRDLRLFWAIAAPWMLMYALMPQMIERYLMWPAVICSAAAAVRFNSFLLWAAMTAVAWELMTHYMLKLSPSSIPERAYLPDFERFYPDISWAVLIFAGVSLYLALSPGRRQTALPDSPADP